MVILGTLQLFIELARTNNISQTATAFGIKQPAVSLRLKALEEQMGTLLFDRVGRTIRLNKNGERFREFAVYTLAHLEETRRAIRDEDKAAQEILIVSSEGFFGSSYLPQLIGEFEAKYPVIKTVVKTYHSDEIVELVEAGECEFGFANVSNVIRSQKILTDFSFDAPMYFVCSPVNPFAKEKSLRPKEIKDASLIIPPPETTFHEYITGVFKKRGVHFNHQRPVDSLETIKKMVAGNQGVTMLPQYVVQQEIDEGKLVHVPLDGIRLTRKLVCIHNIANPISKSVRNFIETAEAFLSQQKLLTRSGR